MKQIRQEHFKKLGGMIRKQRVQLKLSQQDVAQQCGLKVSTLRKLEESVSLPVSEENLIKIAHSLEMDPNDLLDAAQKYKENLILFLHRYRGEVEALIDALKVYSPDEISKIILYTLTGKDAEEILGSG